MILEHSRYVAEFPAVADLQILSFEGKIERTRGKMAQSPGIFATSATSAALGSCMGFVLALQCQYELIQLFIFL